MIDLLGPLVRARIAMLLGGRPFDIARIPGVGVVLSIHHEHADVHVDTALVPNMLELDRTEALRENLATMVKALDKAAYPDRVTRFIAATREYHRLEREHFDNMRRVPRMKAAPLHRDAWRA